VYWSIHFTCCLKNNRMHRCNYPVVTNSAVSTDTRHLKKSGNHRDLVVIIINGLSTR
jgi:hypothetical protein